MAKRTINISKHPNTKLNYINYNKQQWKQSAYKNKLKLYLQHDI